MEKGKVEITRWKRKEEVRIGDLKRGREERKENDTEK